jgi:hypothetical protein
MGPLHRGHGFITTTAVTTHKLQLNGRGTGR